MSLKLELRDKVKRVVTKHDFSVFVGDLLTALREDPSEWGENNDLETYLQGIEYYSLNVERTYENQGRAYPKEPTWEVFAQILLGATIYE